MTKSPYSLSLVLPSFNDKESIVKAVEKSDDALNEMIKSYEIILIDDGSSDGSFKLMERIKSKYNSLKLIRNPVNLGQGTSVLIGLKAAKYDLIMHNGIDLPFNLNDLVKILPMFPSFDAVVVMRDNKNTYFPIWRRFVSATNRFLRFIFLRSKIRDLNYVQIYKKELIQNVNVKARSPGFVTQELILKAKKMGYKIAEINLPYHEEKKRVSHHGKLRDILWSFSDMIIFWFEQFS